jgi:hypothetical protein
MYNRYKKRPCPRPSYTDTLGLHQRGNTDGEKERRKGGRNDRGRAGSGLSLPVLVLVRAVERAVVVAINQGQRNVVPIQM